MEHIEVPFSDIACTCAQCGKEFAITSGEAEWYKAHDMVLPLRCKPCRVERKKQRRKIAHENHKKKTEVTTTNG